VDIHDHILLIKTAVINVSRLQMCTDVWHYAPPCTGIWYHQHCLALPVFSLEDTSLVKQLCWREQ